MDFTSPTLGAGFYKLFIPHGGPESPNVNLNIWDTAGQERYASLLPLYTRNAHVIWVVAAIGSPEEDFIKWERMLIDQENSATIIRVFSKIDLLDTFDAKDNKIPMVVYTSAKNDTGCDELLRLTIKASKNCVKMKCNDILLTPKSSKCC